MSQNCENYMSPGHFLANSTPMASNENFTTYLTSTVHTPVKRYIPTPPPSNELQQQIIYNDSGPATLNNPGYHLSLPVNSTSTATQIGSSQTLKPPNSRMGNQQQQQQQQPQYRIRMKCCPEAQQQQLNTSTLPSSHTVSPYMSDIINPPAPDHYATPPRIRPTNINTNNKSTGSASSSATSSLRRSQHQQHQQHHQQQMQQNQHQQQCDYISRTPSAEYIGTGSSRVITPMSMMSEQEAANSCLHCNTLRRTTGVHQTTQTTGPIR